MIKDALMYIVGLSKANIEEVSGIKYSDKKLYQVDEEKRAETLNSSTLTSIVDYIKFSSKEVKERAIVQVISPTQVLLVSCLDYDRKRETLLTVDAVVPRLRFNEYVDNENFMIMLQSMFVQNNKDMTDIEKSDVDIIMKVAGNVVNDTIQTYMDDGISQQAAIKTGITSKDTVLVPSPALLRPFRTFPEVEQPASQFVFRMRQGRENPQCALFEADGGAWRNNAMDNIKDYLEVQLSGIENVIIIS